MSCGYIIVGSHVLNEMKNTYKYSINFNLRLYLIVTILSLNF